MHKVASGRNFKCIATVYKAEVCNVMAYSSICRMNVLPTKLTLLDSIQKKALKFIGNNATFAYVQLAIIINLLHKWQVAITPLSKMYTANNGYATLSFELERGVRKGCPLSGIIFIIVVEILANSIRTNHMIKGINIKGDKYKVSQYADDTSCFIRDPESVERLFDKLETFKCCSGLELNRSKTEALWLGKSRPYPANLFGIK